MGRKALIGVTLVLSFSVMVGARAQEMTDKEAANAEWLSKFATIAGVWALNQRCGHIEGEAKRTFEKDVAAINISFQQRYGSEQIIRMQQAGRRTAYSDKYACGANTLNIVTDGVALARELRPDVDFADREQEVGLLSLALGGARRCLSEDDPKLVSLEEAHTRLTERASELVSGVSFESTIKDYLDQGLNGPNPVCGKQADAMAERLVIWVAGRQKMANENR